MLLGKFKLLSINELEAKGNFLPSALIAFYDETSGETLNLVADRDTYDALAAMDQFADVLVKLRWRKVDLASLGGSGRGKAYPLQVVGLASAKDAA